MTTHRSSGPAVHTELNRALAAHGPARIEGLVRLSHAHPEFAPVWVALAEEHLRARRKEEAIQAARRALKLDSDMRRQFSPELVEVTRSLAPAKARTAVPDLANAPPPPSVGRGNAMKRLDKPTSSGPAAQALQQASILVGYHRRKRLEELSEEFPDHAPIWIALAEETLVQRSVEQAMAAAECGLELDPSLEGVMSPPLARAWKYHKKESRRAAANSRPQSEGNAQPSGPSAGAGSQMSRAQGAGAGAQMPGRNAEEPAKATPRLNKMLATALALRSRKERINVLEQLRTMDPADDDVLFHLAKELALDHRMEDARVTGDKLRELSPERYNELYAWAESHWTATNSAATRKPSENTQALHGANDQVANNAPAAAAVAVNVPQYRPPGAKTRDVRSEMKPSVRAEPAANSAPDADAHDRGKENSEFKTVVMNVSEINRLAEKTKSKPQATEIQMHPPVHVPEPDRTVKSPAPRAARPAKPPPDTYVDVRPLGRRQASDLAPGADLQFKAPAGADNAMHTARIDLERALEDERSPSMPSWLNNPRPWATPAGGSRSTPPPHGHTDAPASAQPMPAPTNPMPTPRRPEREARSPLDTAAAPEPARPRAHPRLVPNRKRGPSEPKKPG